MTSGMAEAIKNAVNMVIDNSQLTDLKTGTVTSINPLTVQITINLVIPASALIVPRHLTDYDTEFKFTDPADLDVFTTWDMDEKVESDEEKISFKGKVQHKITIYNALQVGDKVALLREQGGNKFYILDRIS